MQIEEPPMPEGLYKSYTTLQVAISANVQDTATVVHSTQMSSTAAKAIVTIVKVPGWTAYAFAADNTTDEDPVCIRKSHVLYAQIRMMCTIQSDS